MILHEKPLNVKQKIKKKLSDGNIYSYLKESWQLSWPMLAIMFFEFAISMTDIYVAGRLNKEVQAAVGIATQVYFFFIMIGYAITTGTVSIVSRLFSADEPLKFKQAIFTSVVSACVLGIVASVGGFFFSKSLLEFMNAPPEIAVYAEPLLEIYAIGLFCHLIYVTLNGILRSCRMMKLVMKIVFMSAILNIGLNILFVFHTPLGFRGLALSTTVAIMISFILSSKKVYNMLEKTYSFSFSLLKSILKVGWPSAIIASSWQLASILIYYIIASLPNSAEVIAATSSIVTALTDNTTMITSTATSVASVLSDNATTVTNAVSNSTATIAAAAYATGLRIESAIYLPAFAFNMANVTIMGNLMGRKMYDEAYKSVLTTAFISVTINIVLAVIVLLNAETLASLLSKEQAVVDEIIIYLYISMIAEPFIALNLAVAGGLTGAGDTRATMLYSVVTVWIFRIPVAYFFGIVLQYGSAGIWFGLTIGFFVQAILTFRRLRSKKWIKEIL